MKIIIWAGVLLISAHLAFAEDVPLITNESLKKYDNVPGVMREKPAQVQSAPDRNETEPDTSTQFKNHGNGTVTDNVTQFMWQQIDDGVKRNWAHATSYCENLKLGGHGGWRLPTTEEFKTIIDTTRQNPSIDTTYFPSTKSADYWTCATDGKVRTNAWVIGFYNGRMTSDFKTNNYYVRCVR